MFDVFKNYATDTDLEVTGFKMPLSKEAGVYVARANNENYLRRMAELYEENRVVLDREDAAATELDRKLTRRAQAETILVGFYGKLSFKGKAIKYSVDNADKLLEVRDFQLMVMSAATDRQNYAIKTEAADTKK